MPSNDAPRNKPQFASVLSATDEMDVTDEPMVATSQLLFRNDAPSDSASLSLDLSSERLSAPLPSASLHAPPPVDAIAFLEELLARVRANFRRPTTR